MKYGYRVEAMQCKNMGGSYGDAEDAQWSCTAEIPEEFKLGRTEVICEGYASPEDPYILKGKNNSIVVLTDRIMRCGILVAPHSKGERHVPGTWIQKPIFRFPYLRRPESIALGEISVKFLPVHLVQPYQRFHHIGHKSRPWQPSPPSCNHLGQLSPPTLDFPRP